MIKKIFLLLLLANLSYCGFAWIYPEHRDIAALAIKNLDPVRRAEIERLWSLARKGQELRLCPSTIDTGQSRKPSCLDYAAFPGIAGDHSTSSADMLNNILNTEWIMRVADVAAELKIGIANAKNRSERLNKLRDSDLKLLRVDPEYVTRAGSNNVHFMLARPDVNTTAKQYFYACFKQGAELNAAGTYAWYHLSALLKAEKFASDSLSAGQKSELILSALADEAFAIHFLEDMFASGHVAGTWGNSAQRKGTHDYYDEKGLEVSNWNGEKMILTGDAFILPLDLDRAAADIQLSLTQVVDAAFRKGPALIAAKEEVTMGPDTLNVSKNNFMPIHKIDTVYGRLLNPILMPTPVPGLASGLGELPRFRSEIGPYIGLTAAARGNVVFGGFGYYQEMTGVVPGLEMAVRIGLGLEGVLNEAGDGQIFLDIGWRQDGASSMKLSADPDLKQFGAIYSAIPARDAFYARLRMPFYIIPGDVLIVAPILYLFNRAAATRMLTKAGNGGLIPWQIGFVTSIGRFQFILGREVAVYLYGWPKNADRYILPVEINGMPDQVLVSLRTTQLEFPILEYRPFHTFSSNQTASLVVQVFGGFDIPGKCQVVWPEGFSAPKTTTTWTIGLRIAFDWRYYFSNKKS
ncbi:MAG: hypothetical protein NTU51_02490 [Bacteroidetes bacterium]|nr:hypothetical protein [Bacteroidota bacterium]